MPDEPAYWFVFCKDELLLEKNEKGEPGQIPFGVLPPVALSDWHTVHRITPMSDQHPCRAVSWTGLSSKMSVMSWSVFVLHSISWIMPCTERPVRLLRSYIGIRIPVFVEFVVHRCVCILTLAKGVQIVVRRFGLSCLRQLLYWSVGRMTKYCWCMPIISEAIIMDW